MRWTYCRAAHHHWPVCPVASPWRSTLWWCRCYPGPHMPQWRSSGCHAAHHGSAKRRKYTQAYSFGFYRAFIPRPSFAVLTHSGKTASNKIGTLEIEMERELYEVRVATMNKTSKHATDFGPCSKFFPFWNKMELEWDGRDWDDVGTNRARSEWNVNGGDQERTREPTLNCMIRI